MTIKPISALRELQEVKILGVQTLTTQSQTQLNHNNK